jgi:Trk K+ transport system NAD-binding subunit
LQSLFFVVPILGLTVIIEAIIDMATMLRDRSRCERSWCVMMTSSMSDHIVLVGIGKLGYKTFHLLRRLGQSVVVIERNSSNQFLEDVRRDGSPLLIGDARREAMLEDANVKHARGLILATDDDLANLEIALDARRLAPGLRVVVRMFDQNMADKVRDGFNIHIAMSQSALSAPAFATAAIEPSIINSMVVGDRLVVIQRWTVREGGPFCDKSVGEILVEHACSVVEHRPKNAPGRVFPGPDARVMPGDEILVQGTFDELTRLRRGYPEPIRRISG